MPSAPSGRRSKVQREGFPVHIRLDEGRHSGVTRIADDLPAQGKALHLNVGHLLKYSEEGDCAIEFRRQSAVGHDLGTAAVPGTQPNAIAPENIVCVRRAIAQIGVECL